MLQTDTRSSAPTPDRNRSRQRSARNHQYMTALVSIPDVDDRVGGRRRSMSIRNNASRTSRRYTIQIHRSDHPHTSHHRDRTRRSASGGYPNHQQERENQDDDAQLVP